MSDQDQGHRTTVLFLCRHNAARSQIAEGYMKALSKANINVLSAGTTPKDSINPWVIAAMAEDGIDISNYVPSVLNEESIKAADIVITMGCGDVCPKYEKKRYEDWALVNPVGQTIETIRPIRDEIKTRIENLLFELEVLDTVFSS
jgi:arsenate reductase